MGARIKDRLTLSRFSVEIFMGLTSASVALSNVLCIFSTSRSSSSSNLSCLTIPDRNLQVYAR